MVRQVTGAALVCAAIATGAGAEPVSRDIAKEALFSTREPVLSVADSLSASDKDTLRALLPLMQERLVATVGYYGAFAYSPTEGLVSNSLQGALNFHVLAAAENAALAACEAAKSDGSADCVVAAKLLPRRYEPRAFTLSQEATEVFTKEYARGRGARSFAISPTGGAFAWATDAGSALVDCAAKNGATDCVIVIQEE